MAKAKMGQVQATALVFGNMVGSGVFLLPAALAPYGGYYGLGGWLLTSLGAVVLALVFANLATHLPAAGGPYAYSRLAFGDLVGFLVAWGYWIALWSGNAAIAVAFVGAMSSLIPWIGAVPWHGAAVAIAAIWTLTAVNALGVRSAGAVQVVTSVLKMLPLLAVAFWGLSRFKLSELPLPTVDLPPLAALGATAALTLWAFLGLESATVPADSVENPQRTIPRATVLGTVSAAFLYVIATLAIFAVVPQAQLATSSAPFALAAENLWGAGAAALVAAGAAISAFGTLNGWILLQAQLPLAAARDGLFPAFFARLNGRGAPAAGLVAGSLLQTAMICLNYSEGLVAQFTFIILLATMATLVPYVFSSAGLLLLLMREPERFAGASRPKLMTFGLLGFLYAVAAIGGSGEKTVFWGFLLLLLGIPFYIWQVGQKKTREAA
jgi:basic amino acid/polyamine antiporter, APA family